MHSAHKYPNTQASLHTNNATFSHRPKPYAYPATALRQDTADIHTPAQHEAPVENPHAHIYSGDPSAGDV
jgi:hypothetical protein